MDEKDCKMIYIRTAATFLITCSMWRICATVSTGSFQRSDGLQKLQGTMLNIQTNLLGLTTAMSENNSTVGGLNSRVGNIEQSLEEVRKIIDDEARRTSSDKARNDGVFAQVLAAYNTTQQQMKSIREKLEERERNERANAAPQECITAIKSRDFNKAEEKLNAINDEFKTNFIIKEVYDHQPGNFDLIHNFAKSLKNIGKTYWVMKALKYEMDSNNHNDPIKRVNLIKAFNSEVILQAKVTSDQKSGAEEVVRQLRESVVRNSKESVMTGLRDGVMSEETKSIVNTIQHYDNTLFAEVMKEAVNGIYSNADRWKMIKLIRNFDYIEQVIAGLDAMMDKIQKMGHMNNPEILSLAHAANAMVSQDNYANVKDDKKTILTKAIDKLPTSVKSIAFGSTLCIKSVEYNIYMYAAIDYFKYDKFRRSVFGWIPGNQVKNGDWAFERSDNENNIYYIRNKDFGEYLQASDLTYDEDRRNVFCWKEGGKVGAAKFAIEPNGDNVNIKNVDYSEYLYIANDYFQYDHERKRIFTWKPGSKDNQAVWKIVEC